MSFTFGFIFLDSQIKHFSVSLTLYHTIPSTPPKKTAFENIVGKGENAGNQHFLLSQCFLLFPTKISISESELFCRLQMLSVWTSLEICHLVKS